MLALTKEMAQEFPHRWIVVIENFAKLDENRFEYENYASIGMAQDVRNRINFQAQMNGIRILASIVDKQMWNFSNK
jgi:hypothetical protein